MTRAYLLSTLLSYREKFKTLGLKRSADNADDLVQDLLDAGRQWQLWIPRVHTFVDHAERTIRKCF